MSNSDGLEKWYDYDKNNCIHYRNSKGHEAWFEYDKNNNRIHYKNSIGIEEWYNGKGIEITKEQFDSIHNPCNGKTVTIDGKEYTLTHV